MEREKALTAICSAEKVEMYPSKEFEVTLNVLDGV